MKTRIPSFLVVTLAVLALVSSPKALAVSPPPDGGYPRGNTAEGQSALLSLTSGGYNTAVGFYSLGSNTTGGFNTALGAGALLSNTGDNNTATGAAALLSNTTGNVNTATGNFALFSNTTGGFNTANGNDALNRNTVAGFNTAIGASALFNNTEGQSNTAIGVSALPLNTTGHQNTALGTSAGQNITGSGNVCIGVNVSGVSGENNTTRIRNIGSTALPSGATVLVENVGGIGDQRLGYFSSSRRYKEDIKPMDKASETLFALKPVIFRAKGDPSHVRHYGLIAEDVAGVNPDLAVYNPEGKPETLRFNSINAMLLNEFLKQHKRVEEQQATIGRLQTTATKQEATITELRKGIEILTARLKEQSAQIQRVSAQIKMSKPMTQVVVNEP
jgi:trimeric autotransporter adhesin